MLIVMNVTVMMIHMSMIEVGGGGGGIARRQYSGGYCMVIVKGGDFEFGGGGGCNYGVLVTLHTKFDTLCGLHVHTVLFTLLNNSVHNKGLSTD